jgi:ribose 5-phosphate isomerase B
MKVAIACDHRGYEAKKRLLPLLAKLGHEVSDFGCNGSSNVDYPDIAEPAAEAVGSGSCEAGILLEGSGIGMAIVANKLPGVRAVLAHDEFTARRSREHHHCNVICVGADLLSESQIRLIVETFLGTACHSGKHTKRVEKIRAIEQRQGKSTSGGA